MLRYTLVSNVQSVSFQLMLKDKSYFVFRTEIFLEKQTSSVCLKLMGNVSLFVKSQQELYMKRNPSTKHKAMFLCYRTFNESSPI